MADATFAQIEAGIVTRLDSQMPYLAQCAGYAGQIEEISNGLPVEAPAAFVLFDDYRVQQEYSDELQHVGTAGFSIVVVADSYAGGTEHRTGTYGAYSLIQAVITAIDDSTLSVTGCSGMRLVGVEMVRVDKLRAVYRVRFEAMVVITR